LSMCTMDTPSRNYPHCKHNLLLMIGGVKPNIYNIEN